MKVINSNSNIDNEFSIIVNDINKNRFNDTFYHKLEFNTNQLFDHENYTLFPSIDNRLSHLFTKLNLITKNHCLYWFELESEAKAKELNSLLNNYREKKLKKVPVTNRYEISMI